MLTGPHGPPDETLTLPPHLRPHHYLCPPDMLPTPLILTLVKCPPDMLLTLPTILTLVKCPPNTAYHPYACGVHSQHCLSSFRLCSALPTCSQHHLSLRLCNALPTLLTILTLVECLPNMPPTPLTILTLAGCPPDMLPTLLTLLTLAQCTS
ncbi:hypothetical protein O181_124050 [Austropuccinia psidii MF-1]|uniref:Uncharacterized protein n=1 Tax=Austropuccinia psidii MF-1 TaxID=1389203 RepID=A0A9Q3KSD4_9BASI|nr:hypothetical protein [Austropuccinia psidii MF-1]